tara:strand:- start:2163 stop:3311 length:1149 start_codon:yes stop_codon:yes gene_type:complete
MNIKILFFLLLPLKCCSLLNNLVIKNNEFNLAKEYYDFLKEHNKIDTINIINDNLNKEEILSYSTKNKFNKKQILKNNKYEEIARNNYNKYKIFKSNFLKIRRFNELNNKIKLELNRFSDEVDFENNDLHTDLMKISNTPKKNDIFLKTMNFINKILNYRNLPNKLIWDDKIVSNVKNQGSCGSCWAFSSTGVLEANMRLNNYTVTRLSEQELIDCSNENYGCDGGLMHLAFDYCIKNKGLTSNELYPYKAVDNNCKCNNSNNSNKLLREIGSNITKYKFTIPKSKYDLMKSLQNGPVCIAIDANSYIFRFYKSGIIDMPLKSSEINHAVILTGYDSYENGTYWIIQNSWGENWGDNGYVKLKAIDGEGILSCQLYGVYIPN